jgi:hypothetical protein
MTLLSTTTLSGTGTTISSISQAYNRLYITIEGINLSASNPLYVKPNGTGSQGWSITALSDRTANIASPNSFWDVLGGRFIAGSTPNNFISITVNNYTSTTREKSYSSESMFNGSAAIVGAGSFGGYYQTNAITFFEFQTAGATFNAGTVKIYGLK